MNRCEALCQALADLDEDQALSLVKDALAEGTAPLELLKACQDAMGDVGQRFE